MSTNLTETTTAFCQIYARLDAARSMLNEAGSFGSRVLTASQQEQLQSVAGQINKAVGMVLDAGKTAIHEAAKKEGDA
jgi:hypothetical protein